MSATPDGDTLAAAVSVAGVLASAATTLEAEDFNVVQFVHQLGIEADTVLTDS